MEKVDLKKELKGLYNPPKGKLEVIEVPDLQFILVDGSGYPGTSPEYQEAMQLLYNLSFTLKFMLKKQGIADYSVMPLEGLWWADDMDDFLKGNKDNWKWTAMIMQPSFVTPLLFEQASIEVRDRKGIDVDKARFDTYAEGVSVQTMYIGPYSDEGPTIESMHAFIEDNGYITNGEHHEIYLGDPRRTAPERLRTVIRQPIKKA